MAADYEPMLVRCFRRGNTSQAPEKWRLPMPVYGIVQL